VGIGEAGGFGGDYHAGGQRQFQRSGVTHAVHRADYRLRQLRDHLHGLALEVGLRLADSLGHFLDIIAGAKPLAGAADHDQADIVCAPRDIFEMGAQLDAQRLVYRVELLGTVEREHGQPIVVFAQHQFGHRSSPFRSNRNIAL
jgi:hypothetical protein